MTEPGTPMTDAGQPTGGAYRERWTLVGAATEYVVALPEHGRWLELVAWGPRGVGDGPSPLAYHGRVQYLAPGDVAPVEYATDGSRPFTGPDLVVETLTGDRGVVWIFVDADVAGPDTTTSPGTAGSVAPGGTPGAAGPVHELRARFRDELTGLEAVLVYRLAADSDVLERWVELTNTGADPLALVELGSAGFTVPTPHGARIGYLCGQWAQEFTPAELELTRGRFEVGSDQGVTGHRFSPYLTVADRLDPGAVWGFALAWTGSWRISAETEAAGVTRVRAGRALAAPITLAPGATLRTPVAAGVYSPDGVDGLARIWHRYERALAGDRLARTRPVVYNSWEATYFDVAADSQLELARVAAELGVETFVVDDGWFAGRTSDRAGLGDWTPDPAKFPAGLDAFIAEVRALGLDFGLWVEPEMVNPASALYAAHPEWVYRIDGRPMTTVRNQHLLDLGRPEVAEFVHTTLDGLLRDHDISYLKWDFNRPRTEPGRPGIPARGLDLDGAHVTSLYRILDALRRDHPGVTVEGCAAGGARVDLAMASRVDVFWPSDNTAPLDRLLVQHGYLAAHAPHLMSSWVTDAPGLFDDRPRSLAFRFVLASAGVLGIGADLRRWDAARRAEAARWVARYKEVRDVILGGEVHRIGAPDQPRCAVQYALDDRVVVLAWHTGVLDGVGVLPARAVRLPLRGLDPATRYRYGDTVYSGAHLMAVGLPVRWTREHDAEFAVLHALS